MAEDGPAPGRVTAGVGSVSRGAGKEPNSPEIGATYVMVSIRVHIYYRQLVKLLSDFGKIVQTAEARM